MKCSKCSSARGGPGHISSRSRVGGFLTLVDWRVAVHAAPVTFVALPVDGFCRTTAVGGFLGVSIGVVAAGAAAGAAVTGLTGHNPGEDWGYICACQLDSIWMTFVDVVMCTSVLASPNDLNQV